MKRCSKKTCRTAHYPNCYCVVEEGVNNYKYYEDWDKHDFVISNKTVFTLSHLGSLKSLIQRGKLSFKGAESAYNMFHRYPDYDYSPETNVQESEKNDEKLSMDDEYQSNDKSTDEDADDQLNPPQKKK